MAATTHNRRSVGRIAKRRSMFTERIAGATTFRDRASHAKDWAWAILVNMPHGVRDLGWEKVLSLITDLERLERDAEQASDLIQGVRDDDRSRY